MTYSDDKLGQVFVLELGVVEKLLGYAGYEREKLELVQLLVGAHGCKCYAAMPKQRDVRLTEETAGTRVRDHLVATGCKGAGRKQN